MNRAARRLAGIAVLSAALVCCGGSASAAKRKKKKRELPGELVELKTSDGWTLSARYLKADKDELTFILLHESRGRKQNWFWLARKLGRRGFGFLALDLRGHGLSQNPPEGQPASWRKFKRDKRHNDWDNMREDIAAAAAFLQDRGVTLENVAIGGAGVGGSVGLKYAALHPEVAMVMLLSPGFSYREVLTVNAMRAYRDRPILLVVADDDRKSSTETAILYEFAKRSAGIENATLIRVPRSHGTRMFYYNKGLTDQVLGWMEDPIQVPDASSEVSADSFHNGEAREEGGDDLPSDAELDKLHDSPGFAPSL